MSRRDKWSVDALSKGRYVVSQKAPYFATGIYRFKPVSVPGMGTLAVDQNHNLYYDNAALERYRLLDIASILVHELLHILDRHAERAVASGVCTPKDSALWNIAADVALYQLIKSGGWSTKDHLRPDHYGLPPKLTVEAYYRLLKAMDDPPSNPSPDKPSPGQGSCGSCATGVRSPWEKRSQTATEISHIERELLRRTVAQAMEIHSRINGALPSGYRALLDDLLQRPKIRWQRVFAGAVRGHAFAPGKSDYSRQRPSRRQRSTPDVIRPALVRPVPRVAVVIDTSASMNQDDLRIAMTEVKGVLQSVGVSEGVTVLPCDVAVHEVQQVWSAKQVRLVGRGGTDMGEGLLAASELDPQPTVVVVMTDGWTDWPKSRPTKCPVIVLLVGEGNAGTGSVPKWARGLEIDGK